MTKHINSSKALNYCFKVILLGDNNVGKSSIFCRFKDNNFKQDAKLTVGIDTFSKSFTLNSQNVTLVLWDTVGTERFRTLTRNYFRNADACLLVFSCDEPDSLSNGLSQWAADIDNFAENALKVLVGNKRDLKCRTAQEKVEAFAHHHDCDIIFNVSAKTGEGINDMFITVAQKLMSRNTRVQNHTLFEKDVHTLNTQEPKMNCC